jgi:uncharacterized protein (TIGR03435 family)
MLKTLLEERFKLVLHRRSNVQTVYALVVAPGGPKLQPSVVGKGDQGSADGDGPGWGRNDGTISVIAKGGPSGDFRVSVSNGVVHSEYPTITTTGLAEIVENTLGETVLDMTGLHGTYDVPLDFSQKDVLAGARIASAVSGDGASDLLAIDPPFSSVRDSIEKLGLRLERRRAPVERLVIDHVARTPTEN